MCYILKITKFGKVNFDTMKKNIKKSTSLLTTLERFAIMQMLKDNLGNLSQTARDAGIARNTLLKWKKEDQALNETEAEKVARESSTKSFRPSTEKFYEKVTEVQIEEAKKYLCDNVSAVAAARDSTIKRILDIVDLEPDLDKLTRFYVAASKYLDPIEGESKPLDQQLNVAIQNITNNFKGDEDLLCRITDQIIKIKEHGN